MSHRRERPFRFGVTMLAPEDRTGWVAKCRRAEALGYDVVSVADHLGLPPVFPALVLAAEATEHVRVGTYVLNTPFYNPAVLAREVAGADQFTGGRLELGLGAGYQQWEFEKAGIPFDSPGKRVDHLERTVAELRGSYADPEYAPAPAQRGGPPLLLGGRGNRMLRLAAREASVVAFSGVGAGTDNAPPIRLADAAELAERVEYVNGLLGDRAAEVELNVIVQRVRNTGDRRAAAEELAADERVPLDADALLEVPTVLFGTPAQQAEQLRAAREQYGFSYITVLESSLDEFAPVIELLHP
ncbi:F420-dependent oxidoreductase [Amycolatopsis antarctica]|uniref:F420-dependent oxidoreductase n=1 Tax=Amycolatopsis antarctica TaxID=1854586 RepID=A0A263CZ34_9PSEU|nr:TIGR03621 family F420-dependent LLM class oxidoreductase [Amycolatopsis antarctica]OZM71371.1 F420-dependent oxidoreductase [Amycolatopsis antarctica]